MRERLPALAQACFSRILAREPRAARTHRRARLQARKNMAYAWRQMMSFLAVADEAAHLPFAGWALGELAKAPPDVQARMGPWVRGLVAVLVGARVEDAREALRFLGWTTGET